MSIFVLIFLWFPGSLGAESQDFLNFQNGKNSVEKIDENISRFKKELVYLEDQWERYDNVWETLNRLEEEETGDFFKSLDVGMLCKQHEKVLREIIVLKEKICELESRKSALTN